MSGEILAGEKGFGIDPKITTDLAHQVKKVADMEIEKLRMQQIGGI